MSKSKKKTKQKIKKHLIALSQIASEESHTHTNDTLSLHHLQRLKKSRAKHSKTSTTTRYRQQKSIIRFYRRSYSVVD